MLYCIFWSQRGGGGWGGGTSVDLFYYLGPQLNSILVAVHTFFLSSFHPFLSSACIGRLYFYLCILLHREEKLRLRKECVAICSWWGDQTQIRRHEREGRPLPIYSLYRKNYGQPGLVLSREPNTIYNTHLITC